MAAKVSAVASGLRRSRRKSVRVEKSAQAKACATKKQNASRNAGATGSVNSITQKPLYVGNNFLSRHRDQELQKRLLRLPRPALGCEAGRNRLRCRGLPPRARKRRPFRIIRSSSHDILHRHSLFV